MSLFEQLRHFFTAAPTTENQPDSDRRCPDCGSDDLLAGPRGGAAQNVACGNCYSEFNFMVYGGAFSLIDRMGKLSPERAERYGIPAGEISTKVLPVWSRYCRDLNQ